MASVLNFFANGLYKEMLGEFIGTFILVIFQVGPSAQSTFSYGTSGNCVTNMICSGIAVMMAVHVAGKTSGAHVNPAVSFAMCCIGKFQWKKLIFYMLSQYCGALVGGAFVYAVYEGAGYEYYRTENPFKSASIWASFPADYLTRENAICDVLASSCLLMILNLAVTDQTNMGPEPSCQPLLLGLVVSAISSGYSLNCGNPMNPARDFGTRIFLFLAQWKCDVFQGPSYTWYLIPLTFSHVGALCGSLLYQGLIHTDKLSTTDCNEDPKETNALVLSNAQVQEEEILMSSPF